MPVCYLFVVFAPLFGGSVFVSCLKGLLFPKDIQSTQKLIVVDLVGQWSTTGDVTKKHGGEKVVFNAENLVQVLLDRLQG